MLGVTEKIPGGIVAHRWRISSLRRPPPPLPPAHRKTRGPVWLHVSLKNSSRVRKMSIVMIFESKK